jgi:hypothetical protein
MRLLIEWGSQKAVALTLGCQKSRVSERLSEAAKKMNERTHIKALLAYDRWSRT